jgi:hypothetical protein
MDAGDLVQGYVVPDGFSAEPTVRVIGNGVELGRFACTRVEPWFVQSRRHETGRVGYEITDRDIPNLADYEDLLIVEDETGFPIFRRRIWELHIQRKIFRLETGLLPKARFDNALRPNFQFWMANVERFGLETVEWMFRSESVQSVYLSGRIQPRRFLNFIEKGFHAVIAVPDPVYDLVLRCVMLGRGNAGNAPFLTAREMASHGDLLEIFTPENTRNAKSILKTLSDLPSEVLSPLVSPLTNQLAHDNPDAKLEPNSIVKGLDTVSQFSSVTLANEPRAMSDAIGEMTNLADGFIQTPRIYPELQAIAEELRDSSLVQSLLETDLILYHYIERAVAKGTEKARKTKAV